MIYASRIKGSYILQFSPVSASLFPPPLLNLSSVNVYFIRPGCPARAKIFGSSSELEITTTGISKVFARSRSGVTCVRCSFFAVPVTGGGEYRRIFGPMRRTLANSDAKMAAKKQGRTPRFGGLRISSVLMPPKIIGLPPHFILHNFY